jgi:hypothetical protein
LPKTVQDIMGIVAGLVGWAFASNPSTSSSPRSQGPHAPAELLSGSARAGVVTTEPRTPAARISGAGSPGRTSTPAESTDTRAFAITQTCEGPGSGRACSVASVTPMLVGSANGARTAEVRPRRYVP